MPYPLYFLVLSVPSPLASRAWALFGGRLLYAALGATLLASTCVPCAVGWPAPLRWWAVSRGSASRAAVEVATNCSMGSAGCAAAAWWRRGATCSRRRKPWLAASRLKLYSTIQPRPATSTCPRKAEVARTTLRVSASAAAGDSVWLTPPTVTRLMRAKRARNCTLGSAVCSSMASQTLWMAPPARSACLCADSSAMFTIAQHPMYCSRLDPRCRFMVARTRGTPSCTTEATKTEHISSPLKRQPSEPPLGRSRSMLVYRARLSRASSSGHRRIAAKSSHGTFFRCASARVASSSRAELRASIALASTLGQQSPASSTSASASRPASLAKRSVKIPRARLRWSLLARPRSTTTLPLVDRSPSLGPPTRELPLGDLAAEPAAEPAAEERVSSTSPAFAAEGALPLRLPTGCTRFDARPPHFWEPTKTFPTVPPPGPPWSPLE
mmetsp:Transcript_69947/g.158142  ORF Transcript_69947/g.158142 Transcript_69947/m.158142 type:complete len:441 (-) Transcript_69947:492-1814(-)